MKTFSNISNFPLARIRKPIGFEISTTEFVEYLKTYSEDNVDIIKNNGDLLYEFIVTGFITISNFQIISNKIENFYVFTCDYCWPQATFRTLFTLKYIDVSESVADSTFSLFLDRLHAYEIANANNLVDELILYRRKIYEEFDE